MKNEINIIGILNKDGYERNNRVYASNGISCTLSARDYKDPPKNTYNKGE